MTQELDSSKIVVFTGAGVSAESGLPTFRDADGLWNQYPVAELATIDAWRQNPERVLAFYNYRRQAAHDAQPNLAHHAIAELEKAYEVVVVTQNVDALHERAGSTHVVHLHGRLDQARSSVDDSLVYDWGDRPIEPGDLCDKGSQLRPNIVFFGENIHNYDLGIEHIRAAARILVVGTSLAVFPAAGMLADADEHAEKVIVALDLEHQPRSYELLRGPATELVPGIVARWLRESEAD